LTSLSQKRLENNQIQKLPNELTKLDVLIKSSLMIF
jgi:hypothetical protein